jgi:hypothetical protein
MKLILVKNNYLNSKAAEDHGEYDETSRKRQFRGGFCITVDQETPKS